MMCGRVSSTGQELARTTPIATLPSAMRASPVRPCVLIADERSADFTGHVEDPVRGNAIAHDVRRRRRPQYVDHALNCRGRRFSGSDPAERRGAEYAPTVRGHADHRIGVGGEGREHRVHTRAVPVEWTRSSSQPGRTSAAPHPSVVGAVMSTRSASKRRARSAVSGTARQAKSEPSREPRRSGA
jgi:hypothetical protein